jgi:hypothetical protein
VLGLGDAPWAVDPEVASAGGVDEAEGEVGVVLGGDDLQQVSGLEISCQGGRGPYGKCVCEGVAFSEAAA